MPLEALARVGSDAGATVVTFLSAHWDGTIVTGPTLLTSTNTGKRAITVVPTSLFTNRNATIVPGPRPLFANTHVGSGTGAVIETPADDVIDARSGRLEPVVSGVSFLVVVRDSWPEGLNGGYLR